MRLGVMLLLAACDPAFGLHNTYYAPADRDGDGVPDADDNCPDTANTDQSDEDRDGIGDLCDDCPLVSNPISSPGAPQDDLDSDGVGDACDAHPRIAGDCLILLDRFFDPSQFATYWRVVPQGTSAVVPAAGEVDLTAPAASSVAFVSAQPLAVTPEAIDLRAAVPRLAIKAGAVGILLDELSTADPFTSGWDCRDEVQMYGQFVIATRDGTSVGNPGPMSSSEYFTDVFVAQLHVGAAALACRIDYAVATGVVVTDTAGAPLTTGSFGALAKDGATAAIKGIAVYGLASPCPDPIIR